MYASQVKEEKGDQTEGNVAQGVTTGIRDMETERVGRRTRRNRTCFTKHQMDRLEELLEENRYPDVYRREEIAKELDLKEEVIRVWFKNRRAKAKREQKDHRYMYQANAAANTQWAGHMTGMGQSQVSMTGSHYSSSSLGSNPSPESMYNDSAEMNPRKADSPPPVTPADYYQAAFNHIAPSGTAEEAMMNQTAISNVGGIVPHSIGDGMQYMVTPHGHASEFSREATASPSDTSHSFLSEEIPQENCASYTDQSHALQAFTS